MKSFISMFRTIYQFDSDEITMILIDPEDRTKAENDQRKADLIRNPREVQQ